MKRILEYKVFDLLKDKDNVEFLDKVKKENPDMYAQFLSTLGNKGLEVAKKKYQDYDPEFVKSEKLRKKRENTKEFKDKKKEEILITWADEIKEIEDILSNTKLKNVQNYIESNSIISKYIRSAGYKKKYENVFLKLIKTPFSLAREFRSRYNIHIDTLTFIDKYYDKFFGGNKNIFIRVDQFYVMTSIKTVFFNIKFSMPNTDDDDEYYSMPSVDRNKDSKFLEYRNNYIRMNLNLNRIDIIELYETIKEFSNVLSDDYYENWKLEQQANKYNI
jgi:hypothetical protein